MRECLTDYTTDGVLALAVEIPSVKPLNVADRKTINEIFQTFGMALFHYVYFAMTGMILHNYAKNVSRAWYFMFTHLISILKFQSRGPFRHEN